MRRLAAPLIGASAALSVLAAPAAPALAADGFPLLKDPLVKDEANDICLAPTHVTKQQPTSGQSTCGGHQNTRASAG
jgi:hypothetical protein